MPFPKPFARLSWLFTVNGTDEVAETSVHITTLGAAPFDANAYVAAWTNAYATANISRMASALNTVNWADYSYLVGVKVAALDAAGHYTHAPFEYEDPAPGHGSSTDVLPQSSVVASLRSGLTFGTSNYGRMYLPHTTLGTVATHPYGAAADCNALATSVASMLHLINTDSNGMVAGSGVVNISKVGAGSVKGVATVVVGDITDTQRRRRAQLNENYYAHAV